MAISIHALREEGDRIQQLTQDGVLISIHALREEGDLAREFIASKSPFLSTPSVRRATADPSWIQCLQQISIHALREEGDESPEDREEREAYFYPRPP